MPILQQCHRIAKKIVYGDTLIPQEFTVAMRAPQQEVAVYLHGMGSVVDVTNRHSIVCCAPFLLGISIGEERIGALNQGTQVSLHFCERSGQQRILGVIRLKLEATISIGSFSVSLFKGVNSVNDCLPRLRLWAHSLPLATTNWWKKPKFTACDASLLIRSASATTRRGERWGGL